MKSRQCGIRRHVIWLTLAPLLVMAASLESFFLHAQFADMNQDLLSRGQLIARQLAASTEYGVFSNNRTFLAKVAKNALQEADVKAVMLLNAAAEVIEISGEMKPQANNLSKLPSREIPMIDDDAALLLYQPILSTQIALEEVEVERAPQQIGAVIIEMSWQRTNRLKARLFWLTITATAVFLLITLYLVYLASRLIIEPIRGLSGAVDAIAAGNLDARVRVSNHVSELCALGNGINQMATELQREQAVVQAAHATLDQVNRNLEQTVEKRTRELSASLDRVRNQQVELQKSENLLQTTLDAIPDLLFEVGLDGHIYSYHARRTDLLAVPPEVFLGKTFSEVLPLDVAQVCLSAILEASEKGWSIGKEYALQMPQGKFWYELSVAPMPKSDDPDGHFVLLARDVSERKRNAAQMLAAEQRYFSLFLNASDAIIITDANGIIENVNNSFTLLLGYEKNAICGTFIEELHPDAELASIRQHFGATVTGLLPPPLHTIIFREDGMRMEVEVRATMIEIDGRKVIQGIFIDLAERKRQEQQRLDKEKAHLNALVREVHHRIKNNLQSVSGLLRRELGKFVELEPRLETAISQVNVIAVVHGLQSADSNEAIRLYDSVQNICRTVSDLSQRPVRFQVTYGEPAVRQVDVEKNEAVSVALVLNELILNAVKHSPDGSSDPTVSLSINGTCAQIIIRNALTYVPDFNIDTDKGLGTGLSLVRSLLPDQGAQLSFELDTESFMLTILSLTPPVLAATRTMALG